MLPVMSNCFTRRKKIGLAKEGRWDFMDIPRSDVLTSSPGSYMATMPALPSVPGT